MTGMQKATRDALEQNRQVSETAAEMSRRMHRDSLTAAQEAAGQAVRGLEDKISAAANHMRLEAVKGRQQALYSFGGGLAVFGGIAALGAVLGALGHFWLQGRADARAFGEHPGIFCEGAGGTVVTNNDGSSYCAFWITHPSQLRK